MTTQPRTAVAATLTALALLAPAAGGRGFDDTDQDPQRRTGPAALQILIASSGDAETEAVRAAAARWATATGNQATVTPAQDIAQQLGQAFAGNDPPDVFYVDAARFADYASVGALAAYGDQVPDTPDFYPALRQAFTRQGRLYCVPKDFSTLALQVNTALWTKSGLTTADVPTTWDELAAVARRIRASGTLPLVIGDTRDRIGAFLVQAGGWLTNTEGTRATADTPENLTALRYLRDLLRAGLARYPQQVDAGWGGEAFGTGRAAMTIEGNWIKGAMRTDYPKVGYTVHELPAGPRGKGTLSFTQCWGIAARSDQQAAAVEFVKAMTTADQQLEFARAFGVMPSRQSASQRYLEQFPTDQPFLAGAGYAHGPVNAPKMDSVLADFDASLQGLAGGDPQAILARLQRNASAALGG